MKKRITYFIIFSIVFTGCRSEDNAFNKKDKQNINLGAIILQERDPNFPLTLSNKEIKSSIQSIASTKAIPNQPLELQYYLGRSYKIQDIPVADPTNVSFPVIDIEKLYVLNPNLFQITDVIKNDSKSFAYNSFDRYENKSSVTNKVNSGFKLNFSVFSIGSKKTLTEVFTKTKIEENKRIFGELNISILATSYRLRNGYFDKEIAEKYLHRDFVNELYNSSYTDLIKNYGPFILTRFFSGGKATGLFTGLYNKSTTIEEKERDMERDINASFSVDEKKGDNKSTADIKIGRKNTNNSNISNEISQMETSVKTLGGAYGFTGFTIPKNINDLDINLSGWASSLNDKRTHTLVEIDDSGLSLLSDYLLETNFKRVSDYYLTGNLKERKLKEPSIIIRAHDCLECSEELQMKAVAMLYTRFGDCLILDIDRLLEDTNLSSHPIMGKAELGRVDEAWLWKDKLMKIGEIIKEKLNNIYKIKYDIYILGNGCGYTDDCPESGLGVYKKYPFIPFTIHENSAKKYVNANNNITYILSTNRDNKKFAYAIHDDYVFDTYGIRSWVNSLPSVQITSQELGQYTIVGL
ncbi:MAC/perforin domain-containing protein [Elizabethkingia ursingii]|uniref:MAC/perforin domain-containing protein n=1 Tax=Elizabethkingia ursingii TaxID=1756150 RepID=UPI00201118BF|nr:MAC/perforin domain-containing protein [Elizabethkingia ursingii]MCL1673075.1 MAC/perforin domain-containing protein [Elizabethkingia ursingii]